MIPGNSTVLAASWVFICASVFLLVEFIALYHGPYQELYYKCTGADALPSGGCKRAAWASDNTINVLGALEGVGWFIGFALLIDWIVFHTFPVWGASRRALPPPVTQPAPAAAVSCRLPHPAARLSDAARCVPPRNPLRCCRGGQPIIALGCRAQALLSGPPSS